MADENSKGREEEEFLNERYALAMDRIREIPSERTVPHPYREFFRQMAVYLQKMDAVREKMESGFLQKASLEELRILNREPFEDILPDNYETSYGNPDYAFSVLGEAYGPLFSTVYAELLHFSEYVYERRIFDETILLELYLELYSMFEEDILPTPEAVKNTIYWYESDYTEEKMERHVRELVDPGLDFATRIVMDSDLSDVRYLFRYGEYITENEIGTARFLNSLPEEEIEAMAHTYIEGFRKYFEVSRKPLKKKKTVNLRYHVGFERMIRAAIFRLEHLGLTPVIYRGNRTGFVGAIPNKQYDFDHKNDEAVYLDEDLVKRKLRAMQVMFDRYRILANTHAGPAVVETFGETPFTPENKKHALHLSTKQQKLKVSFRNESAQITNRYIIGEERGFTIIAFPMPEIGEQYEEIFHETVVINNLDYEKYQRIQQHLIDALDEGVSVHVTGKGKNRTDLRIMLHPLQNPEKETNFENCVADANIPVGEVFTSPVLKGTSGMLHVTEVYLNQLAYHDLWLSFTDGKITDYGCQNFDSEKENRTFLEENLLCHHPTLPMGEFAIGTNTTAYRMGKKYNIAGLLPILIAEKTGPHFAVGDTCYSFEEDVPVYNPDGKEMIARDNEVTLLRKEDPSRAYFGCHTDITIPYHELGDIRVEKKDGTAIPLILDGRFVLPGTEELNVPLEEDLG